MAFNFSGHAGFHPVGILVPVVRLVAPPWFKKARLRVLDKHVN
jgi:hypothetical protein